MKASYSSPTPRRAPYLAQDASEDDMHRVLELDQQRPSADSTCALNRLIFRHRSPETCIRSAMMRRSRELSHKTHARDVWWEGKGLGVKPLDDTQSNLLTYQRVEDIVIGWPFQHRQRLEGHTREERRPEECGTT